MKKLIINTLLKAGKIIVIFALAVALVVAIAKISNLNNADLETGDIAAQDENGAPIPNNLYISAPGGMGISEGDTFTGAACGSGNSFYIRADGTLWATGINEDGRLGTGNYDDTGEPVKVTENVEAVKTGEKHTLILKKDKTLWSMGSNDAGQLGNGNTSGSNKPVRILDDVISFDAGNSYNAAVKADGTLWAWGENKNKRIDETSAYITKPVKIMEDCKAVAAGRDVILVIKRDGSLWDSAKDSGNVEDDGNIENGENIENVGNDGMAEQDAAIAWNVTDVCAGGNHFAYISEGKLFTFGDNQFGQLGSGNNNESKDPIQIDTDVEKITAGSNHTLYIKKDGSLWATGKNDVGQLGDRTVENKNTPVKIAEGIKNVYARFDTSVMIKTADGAAWIFGDNKSRQFADLFNVVTTPVKVLP